MVRPTTTIFGVQSLFLICDILCFMKNFVRKHFFNEVEITILPQLWWLISPPKNAEAIFFIFSPKTTTYIESLYQKY